tara:strand:- start:1372 stop:3543 length:2172 start_codon:yes stop_codon:yes gene_type:complete
MIGLFISFEFIFAQDLPSSEALDAGNLAKQIRESIVVLTQFDRDDSEEGVGTGFVVSSDGLIVTSLHVIGEGRPVRIRLVNGEELEVKGVHAWDRTLDLAVLRVNKIGLKPLPIGDSSNLSQGTPIVAMGTPHGLDFSFVQGVLSARRTLESIELLQLALPIEPGNSGGPVLDLYGRVHGVITMKSLITDNLGFAVPSNFLIPLLDRPNPVPIERWMTIGQLNPKEWTTLYGGDWRRKGGGINVRDPGDSFGGRALCLSTLDVPDTSFELTVEVKLNDESGAAGLVWAADGGDKHYGFYPSAGQMRLTRFDGPDVFSWSILDQRITRYYLPGDWNVLKLRHDGSRFYCYVNSYLVFESGDRQLSGGQVGLVKFRNTVASFRNFQLGRTVKDKSDAIAPSLGQALIDESINIGDFTEPIITRASKVPNQALRHLSAEAERLGRQATQLRKAAKLLQRRLVSDQIVALFNKDEKDIDLFKACLLIAKIDNADIDIEYYQRQLKTMKNEIKEQFMPDDIASNKLKKILVYLFDENGFHGSRQDYYNKANSYMDRVLDDREGLPITLSVLVMELARRCGVDGVVGVGAPGHFLVKHLYDNQEQFIDPFSGGKLLSVPEVEELVRVNSGRNIGVDQLPVSTKREIVLRILRNLMGVAQSKDAPLDLLRYVDPMVSLKPDSAFDRWSRAVLLIQSRKFNAAKQDLEWLLQNKPEGIDLKRVLEVYQSLQ